MSRAPLLGEFLKGPEPTVKVVGSRLLVPLIGMAGAQHLYLQELDTGPGEQRLGAVADPEGSKGPGLGVWRWRSRLMQPMATSFRH